MQRTQTIDVDSIPGVARIELTRRDGGHSWALVDIDDLPLVSPFRWHEARRSNTTYVEATFRREDGTKANVLQHRIVAAANPQEEVDHRDGNGLDNRRSNIRVASHRQNRWNEAPRKGYTSPFKGVSWAKHARVWTARMNNGKRHLALGHFDSEVEAALAYDSAAREHFGDFARTNFTAEQAAALPIPIRRTRPNRDNLQHGRGRYTNYGCRCDVCRAAESAYQRKRYQRARAG